MDYLHFVELAGIAYLIWQAHKVTPTPSQEQVTVARVVARSLIANNGRERLRALLEKKQLKTETK